MRSHLPPDDRLDRLFYIDGSLVDDESGGR
jgi:hypothetical protein